VSAAARRAAGVRTLHAIPSGPRFWIVAADVSERDFSEAALAERMRDLDWVSRWALAHEAVVESFLGRGDVLPMKLFTLFTSDERAAKSIASDRAKLEGIFRRIAGRLEWSVRVTLDARQIRRIAPRGKAPAGGRDYLASKQRQRSGTRADLARAVRTADGIHRRLGKVAAESRRERPAPTAGTFRVLLLADYLVPISRTRTFTAAAGKAAAALADDGYRVVVSGPWPAYSFVGAAAGRTA
jgi:hypothetical protein